MKSLPEVNHVHHNDAPTAPKRIINKEPVVAYDTEERQQDLKRAIALIESVAASLDTTQSICEHCRVVQYNNWQEYNAYQDLSAVIRRLQKWRIILGPQLPERQKEGRP